MSVFVPMAFFPGSVGIIYRQFSVSMIAAIGLSSLLALSLTPALCATILKPVAAGHRHSARGLFGWFNRRHGAGQEPLCGNGSRWSILRSRPPDADLCGDARSPSAWRSRRLPAGFLPVDDQGFITTDVLTPPEASFPAHARSGQARRGLSAAKRHGIDTVTFLTGFSFLGQGAEHGAGLHHAEGLVATRRGRIGRSGSSRISTAPSRRCATGRFRRCSRRRSTISAIPAASASVCRIAGSAAMWS